MDPAYLSAVAALAGSTIGGLTSLTASWLTHHVQFSAQQRVGNQTRRVELYKDFIEEASKLYADAYEHDKAAVADLVKLYALVSRMRILSSPQSCAWSIGDESRTRRERLQHALALHHDAVPAQPAYIWDPRKTASTLAGRTRERSVACAALASSSNAPRNAFRDFMSGSVW